MRTFLSILFCATLLPAISHAQVVGFGSSKSKAPGVLKRQTEALSDLLQSNPVVVKEIHAIFSAAYEADSFDGGKQGTRNGQEKDGIITLEEVRQHLQSLSSYVKGDEEGKMYHLKEVLPDGDSDATKLDLKRGVTNSFKKLEEAHPELTAGLQENPALQDLVKSCQEGLVIHKVSLLEVIQQNLLDGVLTAIEQTRNHPVSKEQQQYLQDTYHTALSPKTTVKHARDLAGYSR